LNQLDSDGRRGKWIEKIQEYDLEIKPTKLVKSQGLEKLLEESNCKGHGINLVSQTTKHPISELDEIELQ